MPCTDDMTKPQRGWPRWPAALALLALSLAGCTTRPLPVPPDSSPASPAAEPAAPATAGAVKRAPRYVKLPPPPVSRNWDELKLTAARRLVAAHPDTSYMGPVPEPLLGIPVLEIELKADGSVRHITVVREPRDAKETIQLAIDAVHRAAPYGDVSRLPKPWSWREVFLFDDDHRFKPATLDR